MNKLLKTLGKYWYIKIVAAIVILLFPLIVSGLSSASYIVLLGCFILVYIVAVSGLDILFGYCGQISLGHAGFFAIGAYGSAILNKISGIPPLLTALIACIAASLIAAVIAFPAAKLKFHFLSLATIAFGEIMYSLISASPGNITRNFVGYFPNKMSIFGLELNNYTYFFYFALIIVTIALIVKQNIVKSRTGRSFVAIRENVTAANGMGINVRKYKMIAFCTSAFFVAFSGAMYGHLVGYLSPTTFMFDQSVMFLTMLLFGGSGTLWGPVIGVTAVQLINELLRSFEKYQTLFYGVFLLVVILFMPNGLINLRFLRKKKTDKKSEVKKNVEG